MNGSEWFSSVSNLSLIAHIREDSYEQCCIGLAIESLVIVLDADMSNNNQAARSVGVSQLAVEVEEIEKESEEEDYNNNKSEEEDNCDEDSNDDDGEEEEEEEEDDEKQDIQSSFYAKLIDHFMPAIKSGS